MNLTGKEIGVITQKWEASASTYWSMHRIGTYHIPPNPRLGSNLNAKPSTLNPHEVVFWKKML